MGFDLNDTLTKPAFQLDPCDCSLDRLYSNFSARENHAPQILSIAETRGLQEDIGGYCFLKIQNFLKKFF